MVRHRLRARRERLGFTQADLAKQCGFSHASQVSAAELGRLRNDAWSVRRIRETLVWHERKMRWQALEGSRWIRRQAIAERALCGSADGERLIAEMKARLIELWEAGRVEDADILLEFMPASRAARLLDWYFLDDGEDDDPGSGMGSTSDAPTAPPTAAPRLACVVEDEGAPCEGAEETLDQPGAVAGNASEGRSD